MVKITKVVESNHTLKMSVKYTKKQDWREDGETYKATGDRGKTHVKHCVNRNEVEILHRGKHKYKGRY